MAGLSEDPSLSEEIQLRHEVEKLKVELRLTY